uniref:Transient receptor ion channel domain-containing protein n=1 Tax=Octopus bimaculoides TaxID=37653 RepID=A0A0L8G5X6_OCTBM
MSILMGIERKEKKRSLSIGALTTLVETRLQDGLTDDEQDFHSAAEIGDLETVKRLVESGKVSSICTDSMGRTCLHVATIANDPEMVRYLLSLYPQDLIHSAFLCAVENDREKLCDIYLTHPMYSLEEAEQKLPEETKESSKDKSETVRRILREALIIAATQNNFLIVKKLMLRGILLDMPHEYFCMCKTCSVARSEDFMRFTNGRLDAFRAIASPAYLVLTEKDPIVAAFHLSERFRKMAEIETEYKQVYYELDSQVQGFTLDLLAECQSSEEVRILLGVDPSVERPNTLPLINMGLVYQQKKFLAHHKCQSQVAQLWYSGVPILRYLNNFKYLVMSIPIGMILIPVLSMVYIITGYEKIIKKEDGKLVEFNSRPVKKYLVAFRVSSRSKFKFYPGLIWEECKQIWEAGPLNYFSSLWNILDSFMLNFLLTSFLVDVVVSFRLQNVFQNRSKIKHMYSNTSVILPACDWDLNSGDYCSQTRDYDIVVSWSPVWSPDPELVSDVCFSLGILLSVCRIAFLMPCNETFGTMLVSFYRTLMDLFKLCGMFALVLIAFTCSIAALYSALKCNTESFSSVANTIVYLTWGTFGMSDSNAPDLDLNGQPMHSLINNFDAKRNVTVALGYMLYGTFIFASTIVLINLLIAVMSNTFQEIQYSDGYQSSMSADIFSTTTLIFMLSNDIDCSPVHQTVPGKGVVEVHCWIN